MANPRADEVRAILAQIFAMVVDDRDLVGIREHPGALVGEHGFRRHAAPKPVADLHIFVGEVVALVGPSGSG